MSTTAQDLRHGLTIATQSAFRDEAGLLRQAQLDQWRITEDGHPFADGDRLLYNKKPSLNAVRVAKSEPRRGA